MYYIIIFVCLKQVVKVKCWFPQGYDAIASKYTVYVKRHFLFFKPQTITKGTLVR